MVISDRPLASSGLGVLPTTFAHVLQSLLPSRSSSSTLPGCGGLICSVCRAA